MRFLLFLAVPVLLSGQDRRVVKEPVIPVSCAVLTADGIDDTRRIQAALDGCSPGKAVELSGSIAFVSGPVNLRRGVTLLVGRGVTLLASQNPRDYDREPGVCGTITPKGHGCRALINGDGVADASVMGDGVIDGRGGEKIMGQPLTWWDLAEQARKGGSQNSPRLLILTRCDNFTLYRITLRNSPNFHVSYSGGNGFTAWGVKVWSPQKARNTDGIDPGNSTNVTITHSYIHTGDDQVAVKAGRGAPTTHMTISHNHFYTGHGMSVGSETDGGASAIRVTDLSIDGADNGIRIKSSSSRGGLVEDVVYEDVCIRNTKNPVYMDTNYSAATGTARDRIPEFRGITIRNTRVLGAGKVTLEGFDAEHRLDMAFDNLVFDNTELIKVQAKEMNLRVMNGSNLPVSGKSVNVLAYSVGGAPEKNSCEGKFVPFPE